MWLRREEKEKGGVRSGGDGVYVLVREAVLGGGDGGERRKRL